jgi:hypothetical protein
MVRAAAVSIIGGVGALFAQADFKTTVSLGSVIVAMLVVILFGFFSLRDKRNSGWKDLYEQEREKNTNLLEEKEAERVVRHSVKDELASTKAKLAIEMSKPDLAVILEQQRSLWTESTNNLTTLLKTMQETQMEMLAMLREGGTT